MKSTLEMAREAGLGEMGRRTGFVFFQPGMDGLERFAELIRADERKPLTDEQIEKMRHLIDWTAGWSYINFARAIEAAHGIKENT